MMMIRKLICASVLLVLCFAQDLNATHVVGGDMTYRCLGNDQYEVTLTVRRDCEFGHPAAYFDDPAAIGIYSSQGSLQTSLGFLGQLIIPFNQDDTLNQVFTAECGVNGQDVCVHETTYIDTLTLPFRPGGYHLVYQRCCRNGSLNNVLDPLLTGSTYFVEINAESQNACNSSPVFNQWGDIYICANEELIFDHSAFDAEGDSLVYRLCTPTNGASFDDPKPQPPAGPPFYPIEWLPGFDETNMMGGTPLEINSETGELTAIPGFVGQFLIGVCVEEYRDGVLLSRIQRDFEYNVRTCGEDVVANFDATSINCAEVDFFITNQSQYADSYMWNFDFPGMDPAFISNEENPSFNYPASGDYTIELIALRNGGQCSDTIFKDISIIDSDIVAAMNAQPTNCNAGNLNFEFYNASTNGNPSDPIVTWNWTFVQDGSVVNLSGEDVALDLDPSIPLSVTLEIITDGGCNASITNNIDLGDLMPLALFELDLVECTDDGYVINFQNSSSFSSPVTSINWTIDDGSMVSNFATESFNYETNAQELTVTLAIEFENGCSGSTSEVVDLSSFTPNLDFEVFQSGCLDGKFNIVLSEQSNSTYEVVQWDWTVDDGVSIQNTQGNNAFVQVEAFSIQVVLNAVFDNGCVQTLSKTIDLIPLSGEVNILATYVECQNGSYIINLQDLSILTGNSWEWTVNDGITNMTFSGNDINVPVQSNNVSIEVFKIFDDGCPGTGNLDFEFVAPAYDLNIDAYFMSCTDNGYQIRLLESTLIPGIAVTSWEWTVDDGVSIQTVTGNDVIADVVGTDISVTLNAVLDNGCPVSADTNFDFSSNTPSIDFDITFAGCNDGEYELYLVENSNNSSFNPTAYWWKVNDGFNTMDYSGNPTFAQVKGTSVSVDLTVDFDNGCQTTLTKEFSFTPEDLNVDFDIEFVGCENGSNIIELSENSGNASTVGQEWKWFVNDGGVVSEYSGNNIQVNINGSSVEVALEMVFTNGCPGDVTLKSLDFSDMLPEVDIVVGYDGCAQGSLGEFEIQLDGINVTGEQSVSWEWTVNDGGTISNYSGQLVQGVMVTNQVVNVSVETLFENGCSTSHTEEYNITPQNFEPDFDANFLGCNDGEFNIQLIDNSTNAATSIVWNVTDDNGTKDYTGNDIIVNVVSGTGEVIVNLEAQYSDLCTGSSTQTFDFSSELPNADFTIQENGCETGGYALVLSDASVNAGLTAVSWDWTIFDDDQTFNATGNPANVNVNHNDIEIKLFVVFDNGCSGSIQKPFMFDAEDLDLNFDVDLVGCTDDGYTVPLIENSNIEGLVPTSWTWTITESGVATNYSGNDLVVNVDSEEFTVELFTEFDNGCAGVETQNVDLQDMLPSSDFIVEGAACIGYPIFVDLIDQSNHNGNNPSSWEWTVNDGISIQTYSGSMVNVEVETSNLTVELVVEYDNACSTTSTQIIVVPIINPAIDFTVDFVGCSDDGFILELTDISNNPSLNAESFSWTVSGNSGMFDYTGNPVQITTADTMITVSLLVGFEGGCIDSNVKPVDLSLIAPISSVTGELLSCENGEFVIQLTEANNYSGTTDSWEWVVQDGPTEIMLSGNPVTFNSTNSEFNVSLVTSFDNGCESSFDGDISIDDMVPDLEFDALIVSCNPDGSYQVQLSDQTDHLSYTPIDWDWTVTDGAGLNLSLDGATVVFDVPGTVTDLDISLDVEYDNECSNSYLEENVPIGDMFPMIGFDHFVVSCPTDSTATTLFLYESDIPFSEVVTIEWEFIIGGVVVQTGNTQNVSLTSNKDSLITVNMNVVFTSNCSAFYSEELDLNLGNLDFVSDPIVLCDGMSSPILANPNPDHDYNWSPTTGLDFGTPPDFSNPTVTATSSITYYVTVSDGACQLSDSIDVIVSNEVAIEVTGDTNSCDGSVLLVASGAGMDADYNWSLNEDFNPIITVNDTLMTSFVGDSVVYYVTAAGTAECSSEIDSVVVYNASIDIDYVEPIMLCPGDTIDYFVINEDPTQTLTYQWEADSHIVSPLDQNQISIGIAQDKLDGFELVLNTTNQFGCTRSDTVNVEIASQTPLSFDYALDTCGSTIICFTNTSSNPGISSWDFGDPTNPNDQSALMNPCYEYPAPGVYEVVLASINSVCPGIPDTMEVVVPEVLDIDFGTDEVTICAPGPVNINIITNDETADYTWCDINGNPIGNEMDIQIDLQSDTTLVVKAVDENMCSDSDTLDILLGGLDIDWVAPGVVCLGDETEIQLLNDNPNVTYEWGPIECIVSGGNTDNPIVVVTEDKDFSVTVTDVETGCMETVIIPIDAVILDVKLEAFPGDAIIVGEEVAIAVLDEPDNVTYEWSTGDDTGAIQVSPTTTTTYSVTVTDENGCTDVEIITITVATPFCDERDVFIPNAFSPNGDGVNDLLRVRSQYVETGELIIYDRWGEEVFKTNDMDRDWDGTYKGRELAPDAYAYCLRVTCIDGQSYITRGNISIIR